MNEYEDLLAKVRSNPTAPALPSQSQETNYADLLARVRGKPDQTIVESRSVTSSFTDPNNEGERSVLARRLKETFDEDWAPAAIDVPEAKRRLQVYQNNKVLSNAPKLSQQFTDPSFANVAHDDVAVLGQVERTFTDVMRDIAVTTVKGAVGLPQSFVGLADIPTGGRVGKAFEDAGIKFNETQKILDSLYSPAQQLANKRVEQAQGFMPTIQAALENPSTIATTVGESIPQMLGGAGIARGLIAKFPALAPWIAGAIGEGTIGAGAAASQIRGETDDRLLTPGQSAIAAASGVGTAAFGAAGGKVAAKFGLADIDTMLAKGGKDALNAAQIKQGFFKSIVGSGVSEGLFEELPQSIQEQMWQNWALDRPISEGVGSAGAMGLLAGGFTGGAAGGFNATLARINRKTEQSVTQAQFIDNLTAASEQSALRQRDPDAYEQFVKTQAEGTGAENMYVDATQFADVLRQSSITLEMLEQEMPEVAAQLADALQTGGDVVIPTEKYAARLVGTDLGQNIAPHIRLDPEALSTFEATQFEQQRDKIIKDAATVMDEKMKMDDAFVQSAKTVESKMLEQLKATKMYPDNVAKTNAEFVRDFVVTQAAALNMMPEDFYDKYMYKVEMAGQQQAADVYNQDNWKNVGQQDDMFAGEFADKNTQIDTEIKINTKGGTLKRGNVNNQGRQITGTKQGLFNFWNWFGNSAAQEKGKPVVMYHTTRNNFSKFETMRESVNVSSLGSVWKVRRSGIFFTPNLDYSQEYGAIAEKFEPGSNVMPVYLSIQNPIDFRQFSKYQDELAAALEAKGLNPNYVTSVSTDWELFDNIEDNDFGEQFVATLKELGYDGAIITEQNAKNEDVLVYVAFDPAQIKSVTGNEGTFNPNNPNILKQSVSYNQQGEQYGLQPEFTGNRERRYSSGGLTPLEGSPIVEGATGPDPSLVEVAEKYAQDNNIQLRRQAQYVQIDIDRANRLAAAYEAMAHAPQDPAVKEAYQNLIDQTIAQYRALEAAGYKFYFFDESNDPYQGNPWNAMRDLRNNKRMGVFATEAGFGSGATTIDVADNPLLADTGIQWPYGLPDGQPKRVLANDLFRAVHDAFGHGLEGAGFRAQGEENAWQAHARLFTGSALAALTTETRGQNSWLNFGPYAENNRTANVENTIFADQKTGLMPEWTWSEGIASDATIGGTNEILRQPATGPGGIGGVQRLRASDLGEVRSRYGSAREGSTSVIGIHYSGKPRASLAGTFYGTGIKGAEAKRLVGADSRLSNRIHFYVDEGAGVEPEAGVGGAIHAVHLDNLYNADADPLGLIAQASQQGGADWFNNFELAVIQNGFDGIYVPQAQNRQGVAVLVGPQHTSVPVDQKQSPGQQALAQRSAEMSREAAGFGQQARGGFDPRRLTTILNEKADFSTFLHETAHFFLTVYADMANMPNATEQMKADMQTLLNWFGVQNLATWNAMSLEKQRKYHEQFAYNYEIYLFEGKAPSLQMQSLFERFAAWLKRVYVSIRDDLNALYRQEHGTDLPILTGEVRQVMDRMLASEEQIKQAEAVRNMAPIFMGQEQSGMDDAQWVAYQDMLKEARESAITDLTKASMRQMKWLSNARGRILKELQKEADTQRKEVRKEVTAQVEAQPLYRAIRFLKRGEVMADDGTITKAEGEFKLSLAALEEMYGGEGDKYALLDWSSLGHGQYGMTAKEGLHPDVVAEMFGFRSGDEMVRALLAAPPIKDAIDQQTDARMVAEYSEMSDPRAMELKVEEALHNEARARFVAVELRYLSKAQQPVRVMLQAAKIAAQSIIESKKISEVRPRDYSVAEGRAAKLAAESMKKGDFDAAAQAKQNQLLQNQLAAEAVRVRMQVDKDLAYLRNVTSDANRKRMGADAGDQVDDLLQRFELRPITRKEMMQRADLAAWLNAQREAGYEPEIAPQIQDQAFRTSYRELSVEQFQDLVDAVRMVEAIGKNSQRLLTQEKEVAYEAARDEIVASINANARGRKAKTRTPKTEIERIAHSLKGFSAEHIKANIMARIFDGGKDGGVVWKYLIRTANDRGNMETSMRAKATEDLTKILAPVLDQGNMGGKGMYFASVDRSFNRLERLGIAANWGNESNRQRLLDGEGWTTEQVLPILQSLTEAEWNAIQGIGDYFESYRPKIAEKERRVYGKEPKWIEPSSFTIQTADGKTITLRGWYYPVKFDPMASQRAESFEEAEEAKRMMRGAFTSATTRRSFTKARVEKVLGRPLLYSLDAMYSGVNEVIHDLSWHEWLIDANKLLRSHSIDDAIRTQYGPQWKQQLKSWVEDVAAGERPAQGFGERSLGYIRQSVSAAGLGFNVMSALQQLTGFASSMVRIGTKWTGRGIAKTIGSPRQAFAEANEKSSFMAERSRTQFRELNELRNTIRGQSKAMRNVQLGTYFMMMRMQRMVDVPTWWGAYEKAISEGKMQLKADGEIDDSIAVALADQAVIDSQGSGMVKDLSKIERYGQVMKLFTVFYSYMNTQYNLAVAEGMTQNSKGKMAANYMLLLMAPVVLSYALKAALTPGGGDDDEWDWEKIAKDLAAEQLSYLMGMMVILRELSFSAKTVVGAEGGNRDYEGPAGLRMISDLGKLGKQASQGEFDTAFRKAAINVLGDFTGLPSAQINRTINGIEALAEGETENPAAVVLGYKQAK